jgi:RimJ/RimL family protein N-acetyltransferase
MLTIRKATIADAQMLFDWRNDPATRANSHVTDELKYEPHVIWLNAALANPDRLLLIAEEDGHPVGHVRVDFKPDAEAELSWTVDPAARGAGVAKRMVRMVADDFSPRYVLCAEVKSGNEASIRVATYAGLQLFHQDQNLLIFRR